MSRSHRTRDALWASSGMPFLTWLENQAGGPGVDPDPLPLTEPPPSVSALPDDCVAHRGPVAISSARKPNQVIAGVAV